MFFTVTLCSFQQRVKSACRIICTGTSENGGMARAFPMFFQKGRQRGRRCFFIVGVGAGTFSRCDCVSQGFLTASSQTCPKRCSCNFYLQLFSNKDHEDLFWCDLQKKVVVCFSANLGRHFLKSGNVGCHFYLDFRGFCPIFSK